MKSPFNEYRTSRHDEICAWALEQPDLSAQAFGADELYIGVEEEIGEKSIDIYLEATGTPEGDFNVIVEVKSQDEMPSAGDIIRQLKRYRRAVRAKLESAGRSTEAIRLVCVHEGEPAPAARRLLAHADVAVIVAPVGVKIREPAND